MTRRKKTSLPFPVSMGLTNMFPRLGGRRPTTLFLSPLQSPHDIVRDVAARARIARTRRARARETLGDRRGERRRHTDASRRLVDARTVEDIKASREVVAV